MPIITNYYCPKCKKEISLGWNSKIRDYCPHCGIFLKGLRASNAAEIFKYFLFALFMSCSVFTPGFPIGIAAIIIAIVLLVKLIRVNRGSSFSNEIVTKRGAIKTIRHWKIGITIFGIVLLILGLLAWLGNTEWVQWDNAKRHDRFDDYKRYITRFPANVHSEEARKRLNELEQERLKGER
jgi:DNA-directed RNA polymerase subunit RPC12/RpoP